MTLARRLAVLTTGRQDFSILRHVIHGLDGDPRFELLLWVGGMHLSEQFGQVGALIEAEGLSPDRTLPFIGEPPDPAADAVRALGAVVQALDDTTPDALVLLGDRSETLAAAMGAAIRGVPLVHLHGGEESEGAIDNAQRHAITKLSHLHLTSHELHARRVIQMGEDPGCVHVVGPPGVDNLFRTDLPDRAELIAELGLDDPAPHPLMILTLHPTTLSAELTLAETIAVAEALSEFPGALVVTVPNADAGGAEIRDFWHTWSEERANVAIVGSLGDRRYCGMVRAADLMLGNSSSGLIEAPMVHLPVVNVGDRQKGRLRHPMTLDVPADPVAIRNAVERAIEPSFRVALESSEALYPPGPAWLRIIDILAAWQPPVPPRKAFHSLNYSTDVALQPSRSELDDA